MGTLYIVATPIGNLEDITVRAAKLLLEATVIACEDTRHTGVLLDHLRKTYSEHPELLSKPRLLSYHNDNEQERVPELLSILQSGENVVVVSDAGTPGISDPGFRIVKACIEADIPVEGLPGSSAVILALSISGLPTDKFSFYGYLPEKEGNAKKLLESMSKSGQFVSTTNIIFVSPHKIVKNLEWMQSVLGDISLVVERELTKIHQQILHGNISDLIKHYQQQPPKGEIVILWHL